MEHSTSKGRNSQGKTSEVLISDDKGASSRITTAQNTWKNNDEAVNTIQHENPLSKNIATKNTGGSKHIIILKTLLKSFNNGHNISYYTEICFVEIVVRALVKEFSHQANHQDDNSRHYIPLHQSRKSKSVKGAVQHPDASPITSTNLNHQYNAHSEIEKPRKNEQFLTVPAEKATPISKRLSRSMESLDNILKELSDVIAKEPNWSSPPPFTVKPVSNSLWSLNTPDDSFNGNAKNTLLISSASGGR